MWLNFGKELVRSELSSYISWSQNKPLLHDVLFTGISLVYCGEMLGTSHVDKIIKWRR